VRVLGGNGALDRVCHIWSGRKAPSGENVRAEETEPDVTRVKPAPVRRRGDETEAMLRVTERGVSGLHPLEETPCPFFPEDLIVTTSLGTEAHQRLALLGSEVITHHDNACMGVERDHSRHVFTDVRFCPGRRNGRGHACARSTVERASQDVCAVSDGGARSAFDGVWLRGHGVAIPFKGVSPGLLIDTHHVDALGSVGLRFLMPFAEVCDLCGTRIPLITGGMVPLPASVRLYYGVPFKNARCVRGRGP
jgi:hypothetical protein